jgi:hypothetical protein
MMLLLQYFCFWRLTELVDELSTVDEKADDKICTYEEINHAQCTVLKTSIVY